MAKGNPGTAGISKASQAAGTPAPECKTLSDRNAQRRQKLKTKTKDQSVIGEGGTGRGTTVSSCRATGGGRSRTTTAHNNQKAHKKCPSELEKGGNDKVRSGSQKTMCGYTHPDPAEQKSGHAEARLLDGMASSKRPTRITFNIDWKKRRGGSSKMPCSTCHKYMCKVQKDCKIEIFLCDKKGNKHKVPCPPNRNNRKALKKKLDGRAR